MRSLATRGGMGEAYFQGKGREERGDGKGKGGGGNPPHKKVNVSKVNTVI